MIIKCSECKKEISDKAATCIGCGAPIAATTNLCTHPSITNDYLIFDAMDEGLKKQTEFTPMASETVIFDSELGSYIKSSINVDTGEISLTDRRIVFCGKLGTYIKILALGPIALLGSRNIPKIHFQFILKEIIHIELGRHGFAKTFFATTREGKKYKFQVRDYEKWITALSTIGIHVKKK